MFKPLWASPFTMRILFTVGTVIGFALMPLLSIQFLPTAQSPRISVEYFWNGTSAKVIEQEVTAPLEGNLNLIKGIKRVYSISGQSNGSIQLTVDKNVNLDLLRFEIATVIRRIYPNLPQGVSFPQITVNNPTQEEQDNPILIYSLSAADNPAALYRYAKEQISPQIGLTDGVQQIKVRGGTSNEWQVHYDESRMKILGLTVNDLITALQMHFQTEALGIAHIDGYSFTVNLKNHEDEESWEDIVLKKQNGRIIRLSDIAKVQYQEQAVKSYYRINGNNSVRLLFYPEIGVNTIQLANVIKRKMKAYETILPNTYRLFLDDDETVYLREELQKIKYRTLISLGILLLFVGIIHRSWQHLLVVFLSLVANLGIAFILYYLFQIELHLYALAGITVSFGIIIDNVIVMVHHLRHQGDLKVFPALLAATLTTIAALSVVFFLPEIWQINLANFSKVIVINLFVSLLIAVFLIPALMQGIGLKTANRNHFTIKKKRQLVRFHSFYKKILLFLIRFRKLFVVGVVLLFGLPVWQIPNKIEHFEWYNKIFNSESYKEDIQPKINRIFGGTLRLFAWYVYENANYNQPDETTLYIQGKMQQGTKLVQMNQMFEDIEQYLNEYEKGIKQYITHINSGQYGSIEVKFKPSYNVYFPHRLKADIIKLSLGKSGIEWNIYGVGKSFNNRGGQDIIGYKLAMYGYNSEELRHYATVFADKLMVHPRIKSVDIEGNMRWGSKDIYEYVGDLDERYLAEHDYKRLDLVRTIKKYNQQPYISLYTSLGEPVRFISDKLPKNDLWHLQNNYISVDSTKQLFSTFLNLKKQKVSQSIHKENQQYIRLLEWEYTGSSKFGNKYLKETMEAMKLELPLGYSMKRKNYDWSGNENQKNNSLLLLVIGLIFFICAILFESLRQAFAIIVLIPTSFIGIFLTFYVFDFNFDQGGYTSFILLSGLVVNSLILIINDYNGLKKSFPNRTHLNLYLKAFYHKITPILLTVFSTALGLLPFVIGGQQEVFWFSLAIGTIGGLVFSLIVLFFFTPLFFVKKNF